MSQPVKLSDALVLDARLAGETEKRSIAGQVEYWASLGKLIDALIDGRTRMDALQRGGSKPFSELVATIGTPEGDARLKAYLDSEPFPHFEPHPTRKGILIKVDSDGTRSVGRFIDREFVTESAGVGVIDAEYVEISEKPVTGDRIQIIDGLVGTIHADRIVSGKIPFKHAVIAAPTSDRKRVHAHKSLKIYGEKAAIERNVVPSASDTSRASGGKARSKRAERA